MTQHEVIPLWLEDPPGSDINDGFHPVLEAYPIEAGQPRGAVVICPGGGYGGRAPHEAAPVARRFNACGYHAFVVQYRVAPHQHPAPLLDATRAVRMVRDRCEEWGVDAGRIAVCGFSAGGHLAASVGVHHGSDDALGGDTLDATSARPDALILCYPVITAGEHGHRGSFENLLGSDAGAAALRHMSLELQVSAQTPPSFLWHTGEDAGVPVENSVLFAMALRRHGVPFELHVYPRGAHGLGLAPEDAHVATWMALCCQWLDGMGWGG